MTSQTEYAATASLSQSRASRAISIRTRAILYTDSALTGRDQ